MTKVTNPTDLCHLIRLMAILAVLSLGGCGHAPNSWVWGHPDPEYARLYRDRDISECERYAKIVALGSPLHEISNAREFGGWGNFDFEFCMNEKNWHLQLQQRERGYP